MFTSSNIWVTCKISTYLMMMYYGKWVMYFVVNFQDVPLMWRFRYLNRTACVCMALLYGVAIQEAPLSPSDHAMRLVSSNLASCHATVQKLLIRKSWPNWWYELGVIVRGNVSWIMCTQPWRDRVGSHCLRCHKQTDDGRIVYITCIPTTCCGQIF